MRNIVVVCVFGASVASLGCHPRPAEGPAERAGEKIDKGAADTKDAARGAASDVKRDVKKIDK